MGTSISSKNYLLAIKLCVCVDIHKNVGYHLMKQAGVALMVVFLLYVAISFIDPLLVGCAEIVFLMWLH